MGKPTAKADDVAKDDRDDRIAELELALEEAKRVADEATAKADEAARTADQAKRDALKAQSEIVAMVDSGAKRPDRHEPRFVVARLRDPRLVGFNLRGTPMDGEFRKVDVTGCSAKQIDDLIADPMIEVEPA